MWPSRRPKGRRKGIVKREVTRVITPGTIIDTDFLDEKSNNYLMGIKITDEVGA